MSNSQPRLCQEVGGEEEQVNASEKGLKRENKRAGKEEEACAVCVYGEVTADGCISLK